MWWSHQNGVGLCVFVLQAFVINGNCICVCGCEYVNDGNKKHQRHQKRRNEISESDLYKILAHYLINSILNGDHPIIQSSTSCFTASKVH